MRAVTVPVPNDPHRRRNAFQGIMPAITDHRRLGHEIRNCMNALTLNTTCLKLCEGDDAIECVDSIVTASDSLMELLDQLDQLPEAPEERPNPAYDRS